MIFRSELVATSPKKSGTFYTRDFGMKAFISEIEWRTAGLPRAALVEVDEDLDVDEFCEVVDEMLREQYNEQPRGWHWELIDVTH
jgi:hypothetical protein